MSGNRAMRRALQTGDALRVGTDLPLITDTTELITPELAEEYLKRNKGNRPVNWKQVEKYAEEMKRGDWPFHPQGIIFDNEGNILTGQTRLWAVVYSGQSVYMRVSRGAPRSTAKFIDRGRPQSARDLATRDTEKKHSPTESSIARAICALGGELKPSADQLAKNIVSNSEKAAAAFAETTGTKKTKAVVMVLATICWLADSPAEVRRTATHTVSLSEELARALLPQSPEKCWGKGAAFSLAMQHARNIVQEAIKQQRKIV